MYSMTIDFPTANDWHPNAQSRHSESAAKPAVNAVSVNTRKASTLGFNPVTKLTWSPGYGVKCHACNTCQPIHNYRQWWGWKRSRNQCHQVTTEAVRGDAVKSSTSFMSGTAPSRGLIGIWHVRTIGIHTRTAIFRGWRNFLPWSWRVLWFREPRGRRIVPICLRKA